jgi:hypothetical protein
MFSGVILEKEGLKIQRRPQPPEKRLGGKREREETRT